MMRLAVSWRLTGAGSPLDPARTPRRRLARRIGPDTPPLTALE